MIKPKKTTDKQRKFQRKNLKEMYSQTKWEILANLKYSPILSSFA